MRIVKGLPLSWEPIVATIYLGQSMLGIVWSPCNEFIAVRTNGWVVVLDAATLNQLDTFKCPPLSKHSHLSFSPDSCSLTLLTDKELISWDLQTGGRLSEISTGLRGESFPPVDSFTYSRDGKMVAVACKRVGFKVYTFDLPSRTVLGPLIVPDGQLVTPIWTHDKYLRFATIHPGSITIWEVEFTLKHPPTKVESFPIPDEVVDGDDFLFLPVPYRLALTLTGTIQVWDVKASKLLLKSEVMQTAYSPLMYSFSSDGRHFASATDAGEVRVWKESPTGYALHQQSPFLLEFLQRPLLSPNGRSIVFPFDRTINLWHTRDPLLSHPSSLPEACSQNDFVLTFSPNEKSAAFAQSGGNTVTILDLQSSDLRLAINTGMKVECLGMAGDTVVIVDKEKIATWNVPGGDRTFNASINDSVRTVTLDHSPPSRYPASFRAFLSLSPNLNHIAVVWESAFSRNGLEIHGMPTGTCLASTTSLSTDLNHIVVVGESEFSRNSLEIHDVPTGTFLASTTSGGLSQPRFTRDGREVWMPLSRSLKKGWEIIEDNESGAMELEPLEETLHPSNTFLWQSLRGYEVTDDGWVLSPTGKRLLWLPHRWRSDQEYRVWSGRFLGLSHRLSEVVILEFPE